MGNWLPEVCRWKRSCLNVSTPNPTCPFCYWRQNSITKSSRQQEDWGTKELMILVLSLSFLIFRSSNSTDLQSAQTFQTFTWLSSPVHRRLDGSIVTDNPTWYGVSFRRSQQDSEPQSSNCGSCELMWRAEASHSQEVETSQPSSWRHLRLSTECQAQCFIHCTAGLPSLAPYRLLQPASPIKVVAGQWQKGPFLLEEIPVIPKANHPGMYKTM